MAEGKEGIRDKLRSLLNLNKTQASRASPVVTDKQTLISHDFWLDIGPSSPLEQRLDRIKDATKLVESELLQSSIIKRLWIETKDLLQMKMSHEIRLTELCFVRSIIKGQYRRLSILRAVFFQALKDHTITEDGPAVVTTFETLSDNGKDVELFEQEVGPLLLNWMTTMKGNKTLLSLLVNIIKFNSSYLDQEVVVKILLLVCDLCNSNAPEEEKNFALQVVEVVICYSSLPNESLYPVTVMLCQILNLQTFCSKSWDLMRKLLGTHLGHSCISTMCSILQNPKMLTDWPLLRSAIFFIGMGLWGSVRVKSLKHTPQSVLPSFQYALRTKNIELAFEVTLTIKRLVRKFGHELQAGTWDNVLNIVSILLVQVEETTSHQPVPAAVSLCKETHELITFIEKLYQSQAYDGSVERLFSITENCLADRSNDSVFLLISYKAQAINPVKQNWIPNLQRLFKTFYYEEKRTPVRLRFLEVLSSVIQDSMELYEKQLVTEVLVNCFSEIHSEMDIVVKTNAVSLLIHSCLLASDKCLELLDLLQKLLHHGWLNRAVQPSNFEGNQVSGEHADIAELVFGLVRILKEKMHKYPGTYSARSFCMLTSFLKQFYSVEGVHSLCDRLIQCRKQTFDLFLSFRANNNNQICLHTDMASYQDPPYTVYLVNQRCEEQTDAGDGVGYILFQDAMECVLLCLKNETCWTVLETVLDGLCGLLQNKAIVVGCIPQSSQSPVEGQNVLHLEELAKTLCSLMSEVLVRRKIIALPPDFTRSDIQSTILSVISCLVSYHNWLDVSRQRQILRCLESGFTTRCARQCIGALTLCLAEMPCDTLLRVLPSVLLRLSQMSATVHMATAVLELLATLAQLPRLYSNFVEEQYMSVFAVALQYTNPSKFSRYVVSLAHYVIGTWFVKCRMNFRPDFVSFITRNLHAVNRLDTQSEDGMSVDDIRHDLMETCIDTMARYTFSNCSTPPHRSPLARFLFDGGPSCTWLVGNKLVTVTTSNVNAAPDKSKFSQLSASSCAPSSNFWPKPSVKLLDKPQISEAPGKLQSDETTMCRTPPLRQRHKSGGAIIRRSLHLSPFESHQMKTGYILDSTKQKIDFKNTRFTDQSVSKHCCLTQGWAEIYIRRPSGITAWSMRIQNQLESLTASNVEDVVGLQAFLNEVEVKNRLNTQNTNVETKQDLTENGSAPPNTYMDLLGNAVADKAEKDIKETVAVEKQSAPVDTCRPSTLKIGPAVDTSLSHSALTPSPTLSELPVIRHRSHTVSTSQDCEAEAAVLISAKLAAGAQKSRHGERTASVHFTGKNGNSSISSGHSVSDWASGRRHRGYISPCFVFLQLFQSAITTDPIHRPILLPDTPVIERAVHVLDRIPPYDTWATGVVYVDGGQGNDGTAILANDQGSPRYEEFLHGLGELVNLTNCDPTGTFLSGLDTTGEDGNFTYLWREDMAQMVFHVTTLMPNKSSDPGCKRKHIGNDYILIAYDDDNGRYIPGCVVQGQFRSAEVIVTPLGFNTNQVRYVFHKDCVKKAIGATSGPWLVSDRSLPLLVRQLALHANMAAFVCLGESGGQYTSKVLARLKQIKRIRSRLIQESEMLGASGNGQTKTSDISKKEIGATKLEEFSDYVGRSDVDTRLTTN